MTLRESVKALFMLALLVSSQFAGAATMSISPSADPGNLVAGDSLTFTISIDSIAPPGGGYWVSNVGDTLWISIRVAGGDLTNVLSCTDLSGLAPLSNQCPINSSFQEYAYWSWLNNVAGLTTVVTGNLFSLTADFDLPGTYQVYFTVADARFTNAYVRIPYPYGATNPLVITVREFAVPEPATLALLGLGLAGIGFSRRRTLN